MFDAPLRHWGDAYFNSEMEAGLKRASLPLTAPDWQFRCLEHRVYSVLYPTDPKHAEAVMALFRANGIPTGHA